jgi:hypothetical protein
MSALARRYGHASMHSRRLESRTQYGEGASAFFDEWGPAPDELQRDADRECITEADYRRFVREWNKNAKMNGDNTRIRSVEEDDQ